LKNKTKFIRTGKAVGSLLTLLLFFALNSFGQMGQDRQLADQYLNNAEYEKAAQLYDKLMDKDPFGTYPQYYKCLLAMKDFNEAEKLTKKMIKKQETSLSYLVDLGFIYAQVNQPDKAKSQYEKAIKENDQEAGN